ncbi:hypothetical protein C8R47DRAFT_1112913 [Mycena vitilis]|nr:hypothetical protein C8R47DRAFT_1112913 [Mycena vitilis]
MAAPLPDEIISEILSLSALKIPDEIFSDNARVSPFASYSRSTSAFLLVCKAWLRVSTPLLYNLVVIRSKAQAQALEAALKSNNALGMFIKKLRVEGGFGLSMKLILKASPNITDLCLSLAIWSADGVSGLCQGLHLIDPIRLIIHDSFPEPGDNKQNLKLVEKLAECFKLWKRLNTVDLPYSFDFMEMGRGRGDALGESLETAPSLEEVIIPIPYFQMLPPFISFILRNPSLKRLKIKHPLHQAWIDTLIIENPRLKDILQYSVTGCTDIAPASNPLFVPLQSAPQEIQDQIWDRILYFVFHTDRMDTELVAKVHVPDFRDVGGNEELFDLVNTDLLLVSKQFKRLSTPYLYRHIVVQNPGDLSILSAALIKNPTIADHVKSLTVGRAAVMPAFPDLASTCDDDWLDVEQTTARAEELLLPILPSLHGLVSFTGGFFNGSMYPPHPQIFDDTLTVSWAIFRMLGEVAGTNLQRLCFDIIPSPEIQSPLVFEPFLALRSLEWKCSAEFRLHLALAPETFANLECLSLVGYHPSFLSVLASVELPALRRLFFHSDVASTAKGFFERHASKLTDIMILADDPCDVNVLDVCTNLPQVICSGKSGEALPSVKLLSASEPHLHLTKIIVDVWAEGRKAEKTMSAFFDSLDTTLFPVLREVQVTGCYWPNTEREIAKSAWVKWAEKLLTKNLKLMDMDGRQWTPRLKSGRR